MSRIWQHRQLLINSATSRLDGPIQQRLRTDLLDLAVLGAELHVWLAPARQQRQARQEALQRLAEAGQLLDAHDWLLTLERERHTEALQGPLPAADRTPEPVPQSARDHFLLGRVRMRTGDYVRAATEFDIALRDQPDDCWAHFYLGLCALRQGRHEKAAECFRVVSALKPGTDIDVAAAVNYGLALEALARPDDALAAYDRALRLAPREGQAALNRGALYYRQQKLDQALADLNTALANNADAAATHFYIALVHRDSGDADRARDHLREALRIRPEYAEAKKELDRLSNSTTR